MTKWTVVLKRSPRLNDKLWQHPDEASAMRRVYALADLHNCGWDVKLAAQVVFVQAEETYNVRGGNKPRL